MFANKLTPTLRLSDVSLRPCQISTTNFEDMAACIHIDNHTLSIESLEIYDCRLKVAYRSSSNCFTSQSDQVLTCPHDPRHQSAHDILDVLLEIYANCNSRAVELLIERSERMILELSGLLLEELSHQQAIQKEYEKLVQQTALVNQLMEDNILVGKELLKNANELDSLTSNIKQMTLQLNQIISHSKDHIRSARNEHYLRDVMSMLDDKTWNAKMSRELNVRASPSNYAGKQFDMGILPLYCSFTKSLLAYFSSRYVGTYMLSFLLLSMFSYIQASTIHMDLLSTAQDLIVGQVFLLLFFTTHRVILRRIR